MLTMGEMQWLLPADEFSTPPCFFTCLASLSIKLNTHKIMVIPNIDAETKDSQFNFLIAGQDLSKLPLNCSPASIG
jgi:hypothetical protein